jgi:hypothetical protein
MWHFAEYAERLYYVLLIDQSSHRNRTRRGKGRIVSLLPLVGLMEMVSSGLGLVPWRDLHVSYSCWSLR